METDYPYDLAKLVESALEEFFPQESTYPDVLYKAMRYSLFAGGKRFRPVLTLSAAAVGNGNITDVLPTACAIEYIHTYSLIHDDLPAIDDDDLRRGRPTCHKVFGEDIAILAGDGLYAESFRLVSRLQKAPDSDTINRVIREIAEASGASGMVGGQVVDMISSDTTVDLDTLLYIHTHKTARLIEASARCGAFLASVPENDIARISEYASHLGLAFQITDDALEATGTLEQLGKDPESDIRQGKVTFPSLLGLEASWEYARNEIAMAKQALEQIKGNTDRLHALADFVLDRKG